MNTISKAILIGAVLIFITVLTLLMAEGGSAMVAETLFTRFGILALVGALGFLFLIVFFTNKKPSK